LGRYSLVDHLQAQWCLFLFVVVVVCCNLVVNNVVDLSLVDLEDIVVGVGHRRVGLGIVVVVVDLAMAGRIEVGVVFGIDLVVGLFDSLVA